MKIAKKGQSTGNIARRLEGVYGSSFRVNLRMDNIAVVVTRGGKRRRTTTECGVPPTEAGSLPETSPQLNPLTGGRPIDDSSSKRFGCYPLPSAEGLGDKIYERTG